MQTNKTMIEIAPASRSSMKDNQHRSLPVNHQNCSNKLAYLGVDAGPTSGPSRTRSIIHTHDLNKTSFELL